MTTILRALWQGLLASPFGALAGALMSVVVGVFFGRFDILPEGVLIGAILAGGTFAVLNVIDDDWSVWALLRELCWSETRVTPDKPAPLPPLVLPAEEEPEPPVSRASSVPSKNPVVLFLCTGNSVRSQMAEGLLKKYAGDRFAVYSAGLKPKGMHPLTVRVMSEAGIDISTQYSKDLRQFLGKLPVRVAISVCAKVEEDCPTNWPAALARLSWPLEDPAACEGTEEERLAKFRSVRDQLDQQIRSWLNEIGPSASLN